MINKFQILEKIYKDPKTGFIGMAKLYEKAKKIDSSITRTDVIDFYKQHTNTQIHKKIPNELHLPIVGNIGAYQGDLIFYPQYKRQNNGYSGAFIAVGIVNRIGYGYPFKSKSSKEIDPIIEQFIKDVNEDKRHVVVLETDNGSEFISKSIRKIFEEKNVDHHTGQPGDHNFLGKIDAFSRTIKKRISQYMTENNTVKWVDIFPELIYNYNHTEHSAIEMEPAKVSLPQEKKILKASLKEYNAKLNKLQDIKVGDTVRIPVKKAIFQKESQNYSNSIYTITEVGQTKISVKNSSGALLKTKYPINAVLKVEAESKENDAQNIKEARNVARTERRVRKEGIELNDSNENIRISNPRFSKLKAYEKL